MDVNNNNNNKYGGLSSSNILIPVAVESLGPLADDTHLFISERELAFTFAICYRQSVCRLSVTLVHPTQAVEIFGTFFTIR